MRATIARDSTLTVTRRDTLLRDVFERWDTINYDVFPGDNELLMIRGYTMPLHAAVVLNWPALLRKRAVWR